MNCFDSEEKFYLVSFIISDTGPGIPKECVDEVFLPFKQLDGSFTRDYGGMGMGLPIAKQLVELLGGTILYTEAQPHGSIITVEIKFKTNDISIDENKAVENKKSEQAAQSHCKS